MKHFAKGFAVSSIWLWGAYLLLLLVATLLPNIVEPPFPPNVALTFVLSAAFGAGHKFPAGLVDKALFIAGGSSAVFFSTYLLAERSGWNNKFDILICSNFSFGIMFLAFFAAFSLFFFALLVLFEDRDASR